MVPLLQLYRKNLRKGVKCWVRTAIISLTPILPMVFNIALKIFLVKLKLNILEKIRNCLLFLHRNEPFVVSLEKIVSEKIKALINLWSFFRLKLWIIFKQQQTTNAETFSATLAASLWAFDRKEKKSCIV